MLFDVYCDESRQDLLANSESINENNRFCCIGGIMVPNEKRREVKDAIKQLQMKHDVHGELRWGTVSKNKLEFYLELVDMFFENPALSFRTVVIDAAEVKNDIYNNCDQELGYYKFYYQLLVHWLGFKDKYWIFADQKTNGDKNRLNELKKILNFKVNNAVEIVQAIDSSESLILQLENILMGAIGYKFNYGNAGKSMAKNEVVLRIEKHLGHKIGSTPVYESKFNIFTIALRGGH